MEIWDTSTEAVIKALRSRGWCFGNIQEVTAIIAINSALIDDKDPRKVADSTESELLNTDLKSIGGKSLPDPTRKFSHIQRPHPSVRDISRSSIEEFSGNPGSNRLLKLVLTDGHIEITAIEYSHIPSIPYDIVPGTKVRLENKVPVHSGIVCLNPNVVTVLGGVVASLHEEWQMNRKYSVFSRSSLRPSQESGGGGPPPFEKFQIGAPSHQLAQRGRFYHDDSESTAKTSEPVAVETTGNTKVMPSTSQQTTGLEKNNSVTSPKVTRVEERTEEDPSSSQARPKEVVESFPVQNQAASQKLLQKMSTSNQDNRHSRGRRYRGKGKEEEPAVFTLEEWEKRKAGAKPFVNHKLPDTSNDEDLAWQLQNQLDLEDSHEQSGMHDSQAENIRMSMFSYERDDRKIEAEEEEGAEEREGGGGGGGDEGAAFPTPTFSISDHNVIFTSFVALVQVLHL
ncbi:hypothetical protein CUMW_127240 [Citrus unshiu]|uniref:RecQ mediated genome instability protein 1 OB-fold domain-containing protein n=1 Tax=Citrus unshiu TaxID=55188 RepID=A0A2H5PDS9_CITUN|nr:hypothetical protein CUMW_127240 [Citrus unshiu]